MKITIAAAIRWGEGASGAAAAEKQIAETDQFVCKLRDSLKKDGFFV